MLRERDRAFDETLAERVQRPQTLQPHAGPLPGLPPLGLLQACLLQQLVRCFRSVPTIRSSASRVMRRQPLPVSFRTFGTPA